jgi:hypothetical protein
VEAVELGCEGNRARNGEREKDEEERDFFLRTRRMVKESVVLRFNEKPFNLKTRTLCFFISITCFQLSLSLSQIFSWI